jgi:GT2 family glycosyltransferase
MSIVQRLRKILQKDDEEFISELYKELLNREPDMEGFVHFYVNLLSSGTPKTEVIKEILSSEEAHALLASPQFPDIPRTVMQRLQKIFQKEGHEFVAALYRELLNREPDINGLSDYVTCLLEGAPKMAIVEGILFSEEARMLLTSSVLFSGQPPTVSCVMPTVNALEMTKQCLDSLKNTVTDIPLEIIVVDDGSAIDVQQSLQQWATEADVHLILKPENKGFSHSVNAGIKIARGEYVLLVNNDVIFHEVGWLEHMLRTIQSAPNIGIVGARLLYPDGTIQHAGAVPLANGWFDHYHKNQPYDYPPAQLVLDIPALTGALLLIKQAVFQEIVFSEEYFLGFEDIDFCYQARQKGWRTVYCGPACAIHFEGKTRANPENAKHSFYRTKELEAKAQFWRKWGGVDIK